MASSFAKECTPLKHKYDNCFNEWYANKYCLSLFLANPGFFEAKGIRMNVRSYSISTRLAWRSRPSRKSLIVDTVEETRTR